MKTSHPHHIGSELDLEYRLRFEAIAAYRQRVWEVLYRRFFSRYVPESGSVLDLGCGWGEFINQVRATERFGMDLNPDTARHLDPGVTFHCQSCAQTWPVADACLDLVFTSNFFEHLPDKTALSVTLKEIARCLKPGGRLICLGPNYRFVQGAYWDFFDHHIALTDRSLVEAHRLHGLEPELVYPKFLPYTMAHGWKPPVTLVRLYLAVPLAWAFFGKQFLVISRKPG